MSRYLLFVFFFYHSFECFSQQKILLIGTHHRTERERLEEMVPVKAIVERFQPGIFCIEYPLHTDTASIIRRSIIYRKDAQIFQQMEALRKEWKISAEDMNNKIETLQQRQDLSSDLMKRMELQQLYFVSCDAGNADYQGYLIMSKLSGDSRKNGWLLESSPGFDTMKQIYEDKRYRNDEYYQLVFPLAAKLNIDYLYPIDDLSTWKEYERHYDRLQVRDQMDVSKMKYFQYKEDFFQKLHSLPKDSNRWLFTNSSQIIHNLLYLEHYRLEHYGIDADNINEDIKLVHYYWVQRNKMMAKHIDAVAREHPHLNIAVFFGVSHVGAVLEELSKLDKRYQVLTLSDVMK